MARKYTVTFTCESSFGEVADHILGLKDCAIKSMKDEPIIDYKNAARTVYSAMSMEDKRQITTVRDFSSYALGALQLEHLTDADIYFILGSMSNHLRNITTANGQITGFKII